MLVYRYLVGALNAFVAHREAVMVVTREKKHASAIRVSIDEETRLENITFVDKRTARSDYTTFAISVHTTCSIGPEEKLLWITLITRSSN